MNRKTLANLNPNLPQAHRLSINPNAMKAGNRFSIAASSFQSSQSTQQTQLKDPRSKKQIIDIMTQFLQQNNFLTDISKGISSNNFKQLVYLIMQPMDTNFSMDVIPTSNQQQTNNKNNSSTFDIDTLLNLFTFLKYPYSLQKRNLQSIGTMHTWPPVLAALAWLAELSNYYVSKEHFDQQEQRNSIANQNTATVAAQDELFVKFLSKAYIAFISSTGEQDGKTDVFERELEKQFETKTEVVKRDLERYHNEITLMNQELDLKFRNKPSPLIELTEKKEALLGEKGKLSAAIQGIEKQNWKIKENGMQTEKDIKTCQQNIDKLNLEIEILRSRISKQELRPEDVLRMNAEIIKLEEILKMNQNKRDKILKQIHEEENLMHRELEQELENLIRQYHQSAANLHLIPYESSKIAQQQQFNYELCILDNYKSNLNLKQLKQNLLKVKQFYAQQFQQCKMEFQPLLELLQSLEDEYQEKKYVHENNEKELAKLEQDFKNCRLNQRNDLQQKAFELEQVQRETQELSKQSFQLEIEEQSKVLQQLQMEHQQLIEKYEHEKVMMQQSLFSMFEFLANHKQIMQDTIEQTDRRLLSVLEEFMEEEEDEPMQN